MLLRKVFKQEIVMSFTLNTWLFGIHSQKLYLTTYHPNIDIRLTPKGQGGHFCLVSHRYQTTRMYTFTLQSSNFEHMNN